MPTQKISRDELLECAWSLIHRQGYAATSLADVAAAAGLGKAGVLHHFGSKAGMMRAVIAWARERFAAYVLAAFVTSSHAERETGQREDDTASTLEARLAEVFRRQFRLVRRDDAGCFFGNAILEAAEGGAFAPALQHFVDDFLAAMTAALRERFDAEEAAERAYRLFTDYQGAVLLYKATRDRAHLERFRDRALASLSAPLVGYEPLPVPT